MAQTTVSQRRRGSGTVRAVAAGLIIGAVEAVLAIAFAGLVFKGLLVSHLPDGIGLYLVAAVLTLGILAWRAGNRGVVGSVQDAAAAVLGSVAASVAKQVKLIEQVAQATGLRDYKAPDVFLTVVAATLVVTVLCGVVFLVVGRRRLSNFIRFVPYPVVGGFLAGTGWLLFKSGFYVTSQVQLALRTTENSTESLPHRWGTALSQTASTLTRQYTLYRWVPAFLFAVVLLIAVRRVKRPLVIPAVLAVGLVGFAIGMLVTGSSIADAKAGGWLLGPFETAKLWQPWTLRALGGADWGSVLSQWTSIAIAVLIATIALLFNVSGTEIVLNRDLDTNRELRDAGVLNVVSGALGGIPGYHALSLTALAERMKVNARTAGLVAALVPLAAVVFGASVIELIPRMIVGGVLMFLGLAFIVEWVWDMRKVLPRVEYLVVLVILAGIIAKGFFPGVALGLVLAIALFVFRYGRIELIREVTFGETYRSNVDRPAHELAALRAVGDRVQILRVTGFVFFGSANNLLEMIRKRLAAEPPMRFLVMDLRRVTGLDSSAAAAVRQVAYAAEAHGFELVLAGASESVRDRLAHAGVVAADGVVRFEPDLDRGLQRCEDVLLGEGEMARADASTAPAGGMPAGLEPYLRREELNAGTVLIREGEPPDDVFILEAGRLSIETETAEGTRRRVRTIRPGVVVGEVAMYTGAPRTADVVAETPVVVQRLTRDALARMELEQPDVAATVHRWLASTLADRLGDTLKVFDSLVD